MLFAEYIEGTTLQAICHDSQYKIVLFISFALCIFVWGYTRIPVCSAICILLTSV